MIRMMQLFLAILIGFVAPAWAATATVGANSCTYSAIAIDPTGNVAITCQGTPPPQESCQAFVTRMYQTYLGRAPQGGEDAWWVQQCESGAMTRAQIEDAFKGFVGPPPPSQCNAGAIQPTLQWGEVRQQRAASGQVMAFPVNQPQPAGKASLTFTQGQQPATAPGTITEFTVSTCPGVIDPSAGACYLNGPFVNNNTLDIYRRDVGVPGCMATNAAATYYINVRWTFSNCPYGQGACGFSLQWAPGPW